MRGLGVILSLFLVACSYALKVPTDGKYITLVPQTGTGMKETYWELVTDRGSKMILTCLFETYSCRVAGIKVFDGEVFEPYCPEHGQVIRRHSVRDKMSVTIINSGTEARAFCQVKATKPYIDMPETVIDSSEHGRTKDTAGCGRRNHPVGRIVNGKESGVNEFPFAALIMVKANRFPFCGGSIISERHILTAAHCTDPVLDIPISVVVGEHDIRTYRDTPHTKIHDVARIHQHLRYTKISNEADIAVLELAKAIEFSPFVGPVCLPNGSGAKLGSYIKVMGWGLVKDKSKGGRASPVLRHVNLRVIDPEVCKTIYNIDTIRRTQICTYNNEKDSCQGDSGGPLVAVNLQKNRYEQVALVSYGMMCASTDAAVNTDVNYYIDWIKQQVSKCSQKVSVFHA